MEFEWDEHKDAENQRKHRISFEVAVDVFDDPHRLEEDSTKPEHGEERRRVIGNVQGRMVTVIFTDRNGKTRIISARRARDDERERYDQSKKTSRRDAGPGP
jgi:hypothetical protein